MHLLGNVELTFDLVNRPFVGINEDILKPHMMQGIPLHFNHALLFYVEYRRTSISSRFP